LMAFEFKVLKKIQGVKNKKIKKAIKLKNN